MTCLRLAQDCDECSGTPCHPGKCLPVDRLHTNTTIVYAGVMYSHALPYHNVVARPRSDALERGGSKVKYLDFERYVFEPYADINDGLHIVLRGHLFIENILVKLIQSCLPHPKEFDLATLSHWFEVIDNGRSVFEIISKCSDSIAYLRSNNGQLSHTPNFKRLDMSEKIPLSYVLGMGLAKVVTEMELGIPWLIHADRLLNAGALVDR
jgi:hypothetical protein